MDDTTPETLIDDTVHPDTDAAGPFAALGLGPASLRAVATLGYAEPTAIQEQTIPLLLAGRDVVAEAPTGTGKTAAYGFPIVEQIDESESRAQALVLVPTRELAIQIAEALHTLGQFRDLVAMPIYGGQPYERQFRALAKGVQVIVGTPGRLLDHLTRKTLQLETVRTVVLDEADEMLNMGFIDDIQAILAALPAPHQTALFSATLPPRVVRLAQQHLHDPAHVRVATQQAVAPRVRQVYYEVPYSAKPEALARILDLEQPESAIVFVATRLQADAVAEQLSGLGYLAQAIHGDVTQVQRERVLGRFRTGHIQLLVGTDVAARGLDIPDVSHVINYDVPADAESYVHRIGRTGRAGQSGEAVTLITPRERRQLTLIERGIHRRLQPLKLPTPGDVAARRRALFRERLLTVLDAGELDPFIALVEDLAESRDIMEVAAAALKIAVQDGASTDSKRQGGAARRAPTPQREAENRAAERPEPAAREAPPTPEPAVRPSRAASRRQDAGSHTVQLFLRVGKRDGIRPSDLVGAIANEAGLSGDVIGDIDLFDSFSFVQVPEALATKVQAALNATTIRGRSPQATVARPPSESPTRKGRGPKRTGGRAVA
ncbi:MAG: ATP-dependent helicase DeaD [Chloroflexota bacterium]|nr:ATP-dependent helicase DeaD [Chloroflexota bacterium]